MKKNYSILLFSFVLCLLLFGSGCATVEEPKHMPRTDYEKRLTHAHKERKTLERLLDHAQSVDDAVQIRDNLARVQKQIEELETGKKVQKDIDDGFESTKKRTVVYGPIGWVFIGSKWILDKLYIIYPWNWRAF